VVHAPGPVNQTSVKFWGAWPDSVYTWKQSTNQWAKISGIENALEIAAGKIAGGTVDDLVGVWSSGMWVQVASSGQWLKLSSSNWKKIDAAIPVWITTGDMTGDKRADIIGSYTSGTWYRNSVIPEPGRK
jgi:hypothetical protein